jgi:hypothetical protein
MQVHGVAASRVVDVARAVLGEPVVGRVVDASEAQRRPPLAALGGAVEHDIEDDFQAGGMQRAHHAAKLIDLAAAVTHRRIAIVGSEVADRLVAPIVAQPARDQRGVVDELVHG